MVRLRVGVLGMGTIGVQHAAALYELRDQAELTAFSGSLASEARRVGWSDARQVDRDELMSLDDVDVVVVCTPSDQHGRQTLDALRAGKHVVVEKPFTLSVEEAEEVVAVARERGLRVSVVSQRRFEPEHLAVRRLMDAGDLGELRIARTHVHWWRDDDYYASAPWRGRTADGGSALDNQGVHNVDILRWLAGPVEAVTAQAGTIGHDIEAADAFVATLSFRSGALGLLSITTATPPGFPATIALNFDRGLIELGQGEILRWDHDAPRPEQSAPAQRTSGAARPMDIGIVGHVRQWRDVLASIRDGRPSSVDAADAVHTVRLSTAIARAAETGSLVRPSDL